ncbi:MAG: hypothetical protein GKC10_06100 [Methanosarcinales archaeon]|nr:hypothetical protein [Methanosarcinales archaeon]
MKSSQRRLEEAAGEISPASLEQAAGAVLQRCLEFLQEALKLSRALEERVSTPEEALKFARALSLYQMGFLPVRPETCPFCVQHGDRCQECGYARTHRGTCSQDSSAFLQFIESFHRLGQTVYRQSGPGEMEPEEVAVAREILRKSLAGSIEETERMAGQVEQATALRLMELKAAYLERMIRLLPLQLLGMEAEQAREELLDRIRDYW